MALFFSLKKFKKISFIKVFSANGGAEQPAQGNASRTLEMLQTNMTAWNSTKVGDKDEEEINATPLTPKRQKKAYNLEMVWDTAKVCIKH